MALNIKPEMLLRYHNFNQLLIFDLSTEETIEINRMSSISGGSPYEEEVKLYLTGSNIQWGINFFQSSCLENGIRVGNNKRNLYIEPMDNRISGCMLCGSNFISYCISDLDEVEIIITVEHREFRSENYFDNYYRRINRDKKINEILKCLQ